MISALRNWAYQNAVKKHKNFAAHSKPSSVNAAHRICIIGDVSKPEDFQALEAFKKQLTLNGKVVETLYYIHNPKEEAEGIYTPKHIKWYGKPNHPHVERILDQQFDIALCLSFTPYQHMKFLMELCPAALKIGPYHEDCIDVLDFMIDVGTKQSANHLIKEVKDHFNTLSKNTQQ